MTYVLVKKLLYVMTIVRMYASNVIRIIFITRLNAFMYDIVTSKANIFRSPTFDTVE